MCPMFQVFSRESLFTWIFKRSNHVRYNLERPWWIGGEFRDGFLFQFVCFS